MASPLVLTYLRDHSVADLFADHGVRVSVASTNPYKASLNYDQIAARNDDDLAAQCRGLVLATIDGSPFPTDGPCGELQVLARPMDRFFNLGHGPGGSSTIEDDDLIHPDARVYEKLDGTLCIVYNDPHVPNQGELGDPGNPASYGAWCVATRSVPDADRVIDGFGDHTFRSLFGQALVAAGITWAELTSRLDPRLTYCFELTSPRAGSGVVSYDADHVWLLAVRDRDTGLEVCPSLLDHHRCDIAPHHAGFDVASLRAMIEARSPRDAEGVVVRLGRKPCGAFHRVKVKSLAYAAAHGLSGDAASSPRNLLRIILTGQWDDVRLTCKPHLRDHGDALASGLAAWLSRLDAEYTRIRAELNERGLADSRKEFALATMAAGLPIPPLMARWFNKATNVRDWIDASRRTDGWGDAFLDNLAAWVKPA